VNKFLYLRGTKKQMGFNFKVVTQRKLVLALGPNPNFLKTNGGNQVNLPTMPKRLWPLLSTKGTYQIRDRIH